MSMVRWFALLLFVAVPASTVLTSARADDLRDLLERDRLAIQKLVKEVNDAVSQSRTLEKSDPGRAKLTLERVSTQIDSSTVLPDEQRNNLRRQVRTRLNEVNVTIRALQLAEEDAARKAAEKIKREQQTGNGGNNPSTTAKKYIGSTADQVGAAKRLRDLQDRGSSGALSNLHIGVVPADGVMEFPKHWAHLTETRAKTVGNRLTPKEVALLKTLNSTMSVDFDNAKFKEVIEYIQEKTGLAIIIDEGSLKEAMVEYDDPVTFKIKKVTVRTILRKILADKNLGYILKEGTVQVLTAQKARETMVVRSYPIEDLVGRSDAIYGPFIGRAIMNQSVQQLITTIQNAIDPPLWSVNGGPGSITFFAPGMALIIRAPAEMHYMLGGGGLFGR